LIRTVILPAAGLGTRMLPYTKEIPKEMLPVIIKTNNDYVVKPILHYIFDALYDTGFRIFYFIVGRGKRVIEDYFTPDWNYVDFLRKRGKDREACLLEEFYNKLNNIKLLMINQPNPLGFGDAVLRARDFIVDEYFLVHAGDDITYPDHIVNINRLINHYEREKPVAAMLYTISINPERYGVITGDDLGEYIHVKNIVEKPKHPPSNMVVVAIYVFNRKIFEALEEVKPKDENVEHQLTDAIKLLVETGEKVHAIPVKGFRLDFGTPDFYYNALIEMLKSM